MSADPTSGVRLEQRHIHGYRRAYRIGGSGPPLLFIHGISDNSLTWQHVLDRFAADYTVIAPDLLGHGESDKPRADYSAAAYACGMRDLLDVLDLDRVTVVGHSLGGGIAMQFAYQFPDRCDRLVLVCGGGAGRSVHPLLRLCAAPFAEFGITVATSTPVHLVVSTLAPLAPRLAGLAFGPDFGYALQRYQLLSERSARAAFLRTLRSVVDRRGQVVSMLDRAYLVADIPILLIWGARDRIVPVEHAAAASTALPGSRLVIFDDAGHFPHHNDPDRFVDEVHRFVSGTTPARHDPGAWRDLLRAGAQQVSTAPVSSCDPTGRPPSPAGRTRRGTPGAPPR